MLLDAGAAKDVRDRRAKGGGNLLARHIGYTHWYVASQSTWVRSSINRHSFFWALLVKMPQYATILRVLSLRFGTDAVKGTPVAEADVFFRCCSLAKTWSVSRFCFATNGDVMDIHCPATN